MSSAYPADLYAVTHTGTPGDLEFYRSVCTETDAVLELGCGAGRVLAALVPLGVRLWGLDRDAGLLALARARLGTDERVTLIEDDMRTFALSQRFDRVIVPHAAIYCLLAEADVAAMLGLAYAHLRPGGVLALDAYVADDFHRTARPEELDADELLPVAVVEARGVRYHVAERSEWQPDQQRIDVTYVYSPDDGGTPLSGTIRQRYLLRPQLRRLLRDAGFVDVRLRGAFDGRPCRPGDDVWVATARR